MKLSAESIDERSEQIADELAAYKLDARTILRVRLLFEEGMLRLWERLGEGAEVSVDVKSSLSSSCVQIRYRGELFNPLMAGDDSGWNPSAVSAIGLSPQYSYSSGINTLRLPLPRETMNPGKALLIGIASGVIIGLIGVLAPFDVPERVGATIFSPLFEVWKRLLNALSAPVVFSMVVTTFLSMREVGRRGGNEWIMVLRYFALSYLCSAVAVIVAVIIFRIDVFEHGFAASSTLETVIGIISIVPENIVEPFATSNTPQLLLISFVLGGAVIALADRVPRTIELVRELNDVLLLITKWVSNAVPVVAGSMIALKIWQHSAAVLATMWIPMGLSMVVSVAFIAIELVVCSRKFDIRVRTLVRKVKEPFLKAIVSGSLDSAYSEAEYSCIKRLGMDEYFCDVALPQGLVMYNPASFIGTLIFTVIYAAVENVEISVLWCVMAIALDVVLFVATPPVPGANLLAFITLFGVLGMGDDILAGAMIYDILYGVFAGAANQTLLQLEMIRQAHHMGMLDEKVLKNDKA